jgi:hypothetical protein
MAKSNQQAEILKLGKIIIKELSKEDDDRLSLLEKWMGHYIAELIDKVEHAENEKERILLQKECFEAIIKLWDKRITIPIEGMPLGRIKPAIDVLNEFIRKKDIWEQMRFANETSWESLAVKIHDSQWDAIKICIQAAIAEDALAREKVWINECGKELSPEEKEIIDKLDYLLKEPSSALTFVFDDEKENPKEGDKSKIESVFNRLERITDNQKEAIKKLRKVLLKKK